MIKNLNQLRRTLREGTQLEILDHCRPECIGQIRNITLVNTQGFYSTVANQPDASANRGNGGRGPILWWGRAAYWQFTDGVCSVFDSEQKHAVFALNNMTALLEMTDWKQVRKDILTTDADWLDLKEKLAFSDDFVEQNRETVTEFLLQGGAAMVCALYGELDGQELAVEALRRIVQAELMGQFYKLKYFAGDLQREIRYPVSEMQESLWKKNLSLARGAFLAGEEDDFYHTLQLGELPHSTCLSYRTGSQRECLLAAFDSNKKIVLVKKDEAVVARACLRLTKGAFQKPPAVDFSFADLSQENTEAGKSAAGEKAVLFLESIYTFGLNDIEKKEVMKLAVSLTTQKAAELGVVAVLARRYLGCYERDEYVLAPFYVYISKSKNGWQYLDSLGGAAYTSAKEEYVEHPFLVMQTAMHHAEANSRNEVEYE